MKPLWVNREGTINNGKLKGFSGNMVTLDSEIDKATIN